MGNSFEKQLTNKMEEVDKKKPEITERINSMEKHDSMMSQDELSEKASAEVDSLVKVLGSINKFGDRWYRIEGENKEKMTEWKNQITEILNCLADKDFHKKTNIYLDKIPQNIEREMGEFGGSFDEEAKTLLSICLWLQREQGGKWVGNRKVLWRIMSKDSVTLSSILDRNSAPSCVDTSFLIKALAEEFGIAGEVKKLPMGKMNLIPGKIAHFYFESETGKIVDFWWGRSSKRGENTGGLKLTQESYDKTVEKKASLGKCGF
ncbi:MAG: hypothetical protein WA064_05430 [Candidatus Moraniibacteriota bacterium]